jgi:hypothetical protein
MGRNREVDSCQIEVLYWPANRKYLITFASSHCAPIDGESGAGVSTGGF